MTRPQGVVFDLGKVLLDFDYSIAARSLSKQSRAPAESIRACLDQSPLLFDMESGRISPDIFFQRIAEAIGFRGSQEDFNRAFADIFTEIPGMIQLHSRVVAASIPTFILSNTNGIAVHHIRARFPFFARFQGYVLSHEVQSLKPEPRIYEALETLACFHGPELLYIDDRIENIDAALTRHWNVIHHTSTHQTLAAMRSYLGV